MPTSLEQQTRPHLVVVGGGAGGLELVTALGRKLSRKGKVKITLIDKHRVHIWKPLLHEVATGSMDTEIDGVVYRAHAARHGYEFQLGSVSGIDRAKKEIIVESIGSINPPFGTAKLTPETGVFRA
jgi:NADH dehydrogenase